MITKNKEFRRKLMKGSKVDDLYLYLEKMQKKEDIDPGTVKEIQRFIEFNFNYEPVIEKDVERV